MSKRVDLCSKSRLTFVWTPQRGSLFVALLLCCLWGSCGVSLRAQPPFGGDPRLLEAPPLGSTLKLTNGWLFRSGDDPSWAEATMDDRGWQPHDRDVATSDKQGTQGWYRLHVRLQPGETRLALSIAQFDGSYRIFVNGLPLGGKGTMTRGGDALYDAPAVYELPDTRQRNFVVAIHGVWDRAASMEPNGVAGMLPETRVLIGSFSSLDHERELGMFHGMVEMGVVLSFWGAVMLLSGGLYLSLRNQPEYLALAGEAAALVLWNLLRVYSTYHYVPSNSGWNYLLVMLQGLELAAELIFLRRIAGFRRNRWIVAAELSMVSRGILRAIFFAGLLPFRLLAWVNLGIYSYFYSVELGMLSLAIARKNRDAMVLIAPYLLFAAFDISSAYTTWLAWRHIHRSGLRIADLQLFSTRLTVHDLTNYLIIVAILTVLVIRTTRIARQQARSANELEAASTMQKLLLARASQLTPGFRVESVYYPESEVGGDFFFVSPGDDGSLTAIVGDVSGKGLLAAMRVSMILGVLRREDARDPATILTRLNEALLTQGEMGFTTACCVSIDCRGGLTIANAGHLSPYLEGCELETAPALPLGLAAQQSYDVVRGQLLAGQRLVLLSDGVVEARSTKGELYGFDRLRSLTLMPAQDIADVAKRFGQEDDITVLTITCAA